jgi:hypothetical protein
MPGYIKEALHKFQHPLPKRPQYAPQKWTVPAYGQRVQYEPPPDMAPPATTAEITRAQTIVGNLLYNARAVDPTLLVPLSTLASQLSTATTTTINQSCGASARLLQYSTRSYHQVLCFRHAA